MEPNVEPIKEILDELFSLLETFETQSIAITQFLKDQGIATDEKLAPYLDRAGNASSVKWRAARARMQYLLSPVQKEKKDQSSEKPAESEKKPNQELSAGSTEGSTAETKQSADKNTKPDAPTAEKSEKPRGAADEKTPPPAPKTPAK
ncbi:MAG: hypothetical protein ABLQ96_09380 [Candidatus Acidiferrum sp.]